MSDKPAIELKAPVAAPVAKPATQAPPPSNAPVGCSMCLCLLAGLQYLVFITALIGTALYGSAQLTLQVF